ncbi:MAG: sigma-54-dependent Fis family transcriptional regulator [Desulfobacteraceae bacterium]|nr:sigma-54-dependent Fis family transcriptional regulator [Desulfobacteraceae bacterium]MBC2755095.1 sigma-54-dependent Fis family transcriptional regulator [Desulfobacteraceae bacterium]
MFPSILIVDDEASILKSLSGILSDEGFETITVSNGYEALKTLESESPDLVLLDIWMPGIDGIDTLKEIKKSFPSTPVIMITGHGTIETAVNATKIGAFDFIEKPLSIDKVIVGINNALNFRRLEEENRFLRKKTIEKNSITGNCQAMQELKNQVGITAPTDAWVLINGENGTGKELVARMIHQFSSRSEYPLIDVNCAALSDEIIESELLGQEKGAFTEATAKKKGKLELAHQGTLFFDEIGDLGLKTQASILRILQEKQFQRVGGSRMLTADVRIIASTNKDLEKEIESGRFREDLYYRLNVVPITVPALRERREDIPDLVNTFLKQIADKSRTIPKKMTPDALRILQNSTWPGNVRELKNLLDRLSIIVENETIEADDIPAPYNPKKQAAHSRESSIFSIDRLDEARKNFEKEFIARKLEENNHDIAKTAKIMGVDKTYLQKIKPS